MIEFDGLGHVNIVADDLEAATRFYEELLGAKRVQDFPHFRNRGFALAAGFVDDPDAVDVSIRFLEIPGAGIFLELMEYHAPQGAARIQRHQTNDVGGPRHLCLRVRDIDAAFEHVRKTPGAEPISSSPLYRPQRIDPITEDDFRFFDPKQEADPLAKTEASKVIGRIKFFYIVDPYGVQWEFEAGHEGIGG
jgi:methylmalonyl-CoA/ethylmalonyl-CoA epimerase